MTVPQTKPQAHITAVLENDTVSDLPATKVKTTYEQRIGAARRRRSFGSSDRVDFAAVPPDEDEKAKQDPVNVTKTPTTVLCDLKDYEKFAPKAGEPNRYTVSIKDMPDWYGWNLISHSFTFMRYTHHRLPFQ